MWDMFQKSLALAKMPFGMTNLQGINLGVEKSIGRYRYSAAESTVIGRIKLVKEKPFFSEAPAANDYSVPPVSGVSANGRYRYARAV